MLYLFLFQLNRLMNEIYETVTAACIMEEHRPGSFPTDQSDGGTSEGKLIETLWKTKTYKQNGVIVVRRNSSRLSLEEDVV